MLSRLTPGSDKEAFYKAVEGLLEGMTDKTGFGSSIAGDYKVMKFTHFHFIIYSRKIDQYYYFFWGFCMTMLRTTRCPNMHEMLIKKDLVHRHCNICRNQV